MYTFLLVNIKKQCVLAAAFFVVAILGVCRTGAQSPAIVGYFNSGQLASELIGTSSTDYTVVIVGFLMPNPPNTSGGAELVGYDSDGVWTWDPVTKSSTYNATIMNAPLATAINTVRSSGKKVLLSFGGGTVGNADYAYWSTRVPQLAAILASYVQNPAVQGGGPAVQFDGIDLDFEDTGALSGIGYDGVQFLSDLTTALRALLPSGQYLITHAPQTPYLLPGFAGPGGMYMKIWENVGTSIDFLNVQYYNNPQYDGGNTVTGVVQAYLAVLEANPTLPASKNILGLPVAAGAAGTNVFSYADQAQIFSEVHSVVPTVGGAMGWEIYPYDSPTGSWAENAASAFASTQPQSTSALSELAQAQYAASVAAFDYYSSINEPALAWYFAYTNAASAVLTSASTMVDSTFSLADVISTVVALQLQGTQLLAALCEGNYEGYGVGAAYQNLADQIYSLTWDAGDYYAAAAQAGYYSTVNTSPATAYASAYSANGLSQFYKYLEVYSATNSEQAVSAAYTALEANQALAEQAQQTLTP